MRIAIASIDTAGLVESLPPHPDTAPKCNRAQSRAPSSRWAATAAPTTSHQGRTRSVDVAFRDRPKRHIVLQQADAFAAQVEHHDLKLIGGADVRAVRSDGDDWLFAELQRPRITELLVVDQSPALRTREHSDFQLNLVIGAREPEIDIRSKRPRFHGFSGFPSKLNKPLLRTTCRCVRRPASRTTKAELAFVREVERKDRPAITVLNIVRE